MRVLLTAVGVLALLGTAAWAQQQMPDDPMQPAYGEVVLPLDGQHTLYLGLVASGPDRPRDLLYADMNCDGQLARDECYQANVRTLGNNQGLLLTFPPLQLQVPQDPDGQRLPCTVMISGMALVSRERRLPPSYTVSLGFTMRDNEGNQFSYTVRDRLQLSGDMENPPLSGPQGDISMKVEAKPDTKVRGNTAIGVDFTWGRASLDGRLGRGGFPTFVVITDAQGRTVREDRTDSSLASFG